ncbi:DUF2303 family protein [Acinetobacter modestus]|uniref:DUF2303 family protein n=1 Tax=Acinetobacter modestus TaxID=1776740 RepID=A0ABN0JNV1_9GAMM|nr:DUF2303 family protein [Acinetobacter modestus]ENU27034.1 hypothetical protein F992_01639 [Acinetobacter modestus]GGA17871.1 hypothetical protein GCM10017554_13310 [Acinetobacter modestus]
MSLEKTEVASVVELCSPFKQFDRGSLIALHQNFNIHDTEEYQAGRNRARGSFKTPSFVDFKSFVLDSNPHKHDDEIIIPHAAPIFVDHKNITAVSVLNFDEAKLPQGHCDYTATLELEPTVLWKKLNELKDKKLNQKSFAVLLEDWADVIIAYSANDEQIASGAAIHAVRNMTIGSSVKSDSVVNNTSESRSKLEQVEINATENSLPAYFKVTDPAYIGLTPKVIRLRLIVNAGDQDPVFAIQIVREELLKNEIIQDFKEKVIELLPDNPVRIGTFKA